VVLTPDRAFLVTRALPCPGKGIFFFTLPLHPNVSVGAGDYHPVQGRRAITNLSSSRHEALGIVTTHYTTYSKHASHPEDYRFLSVMEIGAKSQQFYS